MNAEELRKAYEASKLAKANQTFVKILKGKVRKAQDPKIEQESKKQYLEDKMRRNEEKRQRILEAKIAKAAAKSLKIQQIKERKQSLMTECSTGEDVQKKDSSTLSLQDHYENQKLMNQKRPKETLEEKMERVALKKQKILEEKQQKARKFMTPRNPRAQSYKV